MNERELKDMRAAMEMLKMISEEREQHAKTKAERDRLTNEVCWLRQQLEHQTQPQRFRDRIAARK